MITSKCRLLQHVGPTGHPLFSPRNVEPRSWSCAELPDTHSNTDDARRVFMLGRTWDSAAHGLTQRAYTLRQAQLCADGSRWWRRELVQLREATPSLRFALDCVAAMPDNIIMDP